ncbi:gliding motility-associated C-terminal domain-containing protein [Hymenobacter monticola]|uniref:Gliding motility-associated C-terminal domain-containing protein n=1 Tax=Hymenobacter monticola TaxID=1705399 RepID=A0ABY4BBI7_9BACT|nr:gliding motility-associated C-terminal domain-containing protein [Hymenobacter monticola]UOE35041.1 gliding motility-associated C-terminal domain-containing protein [Hymenobacter monticola]
MPVPFRVVGRCFLATPLFFFALLSAQPGRAAGTEPGSPSLEFIQNQGQWASPVRYEAALPSGRLFVLRNALTYTFVDPALLSHHHSTGKAGAPSAAQPVGAAAHAYTVHFEKANARPRLTAETRTEGERNYFVGNDPKRWASHVAAYRRLRYEELWPGIGLTLYENRQQHLEYDVLLAPGANPARVALRYDGASGLALDAAGNLVVKTTVATVTESAPQAWQTDAAGRRQAVPCRFVLTGTTVTFALGSYDRTRALTIDPSVQFSTLTGSAADNWGFTATYDAAGNLYSGGIAFGPGYPTTNGAYQTTTSSLEDMAFIKYNTAVTGSSARVWATYLGGNSADFPHSLVVNGQNELVILGSTSSPNFPTTAGAAQRTFGGGTGLNPFNAPITSSQYMMPNGSDLVIARLSAAGSALQASTYLGGAGNDGVQRGGSQLAVNYGDVFRGDVLLDGTGNVYIASNTTSRSIPLLSNGFNLASAAGGDALVVKLNPNLTAVLWGGYLGGSGEDAAYSIQRDAQGRVYVSGGTTSPTLPATTGAYRAGPQGGTDGFAARISADGRTLDRVTYIGTNSYDQAHFLQLDAAGNAYLFGQTMGQFPATPGLYGSPNGTLFIQKLNPDLTASIYSTAFGSRGGNPVGPNIVPTAFLVDDCERVYVSGWGGEDNDLGNWLGGSTFGLPSTTNAVQRATDGSDFYLAQFAAGMTGLEYATFFGQIGGGAEHVDGGTSRFDKRGVVYQAMCASCGGGQGFPVLPDAGTYTTRNGSANCNNGAFKMTFDKITADPGPRRYVCVDGGAVTLGGTPTGGTWSGPGVQAVAGGGYRFVPAAVGPGQYNITYSVASTGICVSTRSVRYVVAPPVAPAMAVVPPQCTAGASVALTAQPAGGTWSGPGMSGSTFNPAAAGPGTHTITYTVSDSLGCGVTSRQVVVTRPPTATPGRDTTLCADQRQPFQLRGFAPAGGVWSGPGVSASGYFTPPNTNNRGGVFTLTYTVTEGPCQTQVQRTVVLAPTSTQNVDLNLPVCAALPQYAGLAPFNCLLTPVLLAPKATYRWDFGDGQTSTEATPTHLYEKPGSYRVQLQARYGNCEVLTGFAPVEVGEVLVPNIITPNGDNLNQTFKPRIGCLPASLEVYSRWGQRVYQANEYKYDWDASGLPDGIYYYLLRDTDNRQVKGWVEVRR